MAIELKLPELGENIEAANVVNVMVKPGDTVTKDQAVLELETEKAVVELPCPYAGRIEKINVKVGDHVPVGTDPDHRAERGGRRPGPRHHPAGRDPPDREEARGRRRRDPAP